MSVSRLIGASNGRFRLTTASGGSGGISSARFGFPDNNQQALAGSHTWGPEGVIAPRHNRELSGGPHDNPHRSQHPTPAQAVRVLAGQLAKRACISQAWICRLETGDENPTLASVTRIARALDVEVAELLAKPSEWAS
jgi:Helix-turn-helix domain